MAERAVFLDRDGTINEEVGYLSDPAQVALLPGAAAALLKLKQAGFALVVVTNQSGIARGYFGEDELRGVNETLAARLADTGVTIDAFYHCPHHPSHGDVRDCDCRKPRTGMAVRAVNELGIDLSRSYFVGDKLTDIELGINSGGKPVLVLTGYGREERVLMESKGITPAGVFDSLAEAADWIIEDAKKS